MKIRPEETPSPAVVESWLPGRTGTTLYPRSCANLDCMCPEANPSPKHANLRLRRGELAALQGAFQQVLAPLGPVRVYLFGSRTRPEAKGGDIDLLIRLRNAPDTPLTALSRRLRMGVFSGLEEQKIDIVWDVPGDTSAFVPLAREGAIEIWASENSK